MPAMFHRFALAALACAIAVPASAQLIQRKDLSYAMAKTIAENALEDCKARGFAVAVVVVDRGVAATVNSTTLAKDVVAFPFDQKGLMGGISIQGSKITTYNPNA